MSKKYDLAIFIGRCAPFHYGHAANIKKAASVSDHVLILLGSANAPRDPKNPFTNDDRIAMVNADLNEMFKRGILSKETKVTVKLTMNHPSDEIWAGGIQQAVYETLGGRLGKKIALVGHKKDASSYYLEKFPEWDFIETGGKWIDRDYSLDATTIRRMMFNGEDFKPLVSKSVHDYITKVYMTGSVYQGMKEEYDYLETYPEIRRAKYPINDVTADSVVLCENQILLIRRKNVPGKGLLALPGGFVQPDESIRDGAVRELLEETKLHLPEKVIRGRIVDEKVFDYPPRSLRGRIITTAFTIKVDKNPDGTLPRVYGADDAEKAFWVPIGEIQDQSCAGEFFEDHWAIIMTMIGRQAK